MITVISTKSVRRATYLATIYTLLILSISNGLGASCRPFALCQNATSSHIDLVSEPVWDASSTRLLTIVRNSLTGKKAVVCIETGSKTMSIVDSKPVRSSIVILDGVGDSQHFLAHFSNGRQNQSSSKIYEIGQNSVISAGVDLYPCVSPNRGYIVSWSNGKLVLNSLDRKLNQTRVGVKQLSEVVIRPDFSWSPDSHYFAMFGWVGLTNNIVTYSLDPIDKVMPMRILVKNKGGYWNFKIGWLDNTHLLFAKLTSSSNDRISLYSAAVNALTVQAPAMVGQYQAPVGPVQWLSMGKVGYSVSKDGTQFLLIDARTHSTSKINIASGSTVSTARFAPDGKSIAWYDSKSPSIVIHDCKTNSQRRISIPTTLKEVH